MTRRKFSREFKIEAVRLVTYEEDQELIRGINSPTNGSVTVAQAARDLDVAESVLRRWMRELTATPGGCVSPERADAGRSGRDFGSEERGRPAPGGA